MLFRGFPWPGPAIDSFEHKNRLLRTMGYAQGLPRKGWPLSPPPLHLWPDGRQTTGANPLDLSAIQGKWSQFTDALEAHTKVIEGQLDKMRVTLGHELEKFHKELSRFVQHWHDTKPKDISAYKTKEQIWAKCVEHMKGAVLSSLPPHTHTSRSPCPKAGLVQHPPPPRSDAISSYTMLVQ